MEVIFDCFKSWLLERILIVFKMVNYLPLAAPKHSSILGTIGEHACVSGVLFSPTVEMEAYSYQASKV